MSNPQQVVRWVGQDVQTGLPRKRRHAIRACHECKISKVGTSRVNITFMSALTHKEIEAVHS